MIDSVQLIGACFFKCGDVKIKMTIGRFKGIIYQLFTNMREVVPMFRFNFKDFKANQ